MENRSAFTKSSLAKAGLAIMLVATVFCSESYAQSSINAKFAEPDRANDNPRIIASRHIRIGAKFSRENVKMTDMGDETLQQRLAAMIGQEAKRTIYSGATITEELIGAPTMVRRNKHVVIEYKKKNLVIVTDGRALDSGSIGDIVRVMNLTSNIVVNAVVIGDGKVAPR